MRTAAAIGLLLALTAGCGVDPTERPEELTIPAPSAEPDDQPEARGAEVTVYFVRGRKLVPAVQPSARTDTASALERLNTGPTRREVLSGLRTGLVPESLAAAESVPEGLTTVSVTREFTAVTGGNQLLAVAQVVWTLTELPGITQVRFSVDGASVEVPTDRGLTDQAVYREDYLSVSPAAADLPPGGTPTTGSGPTPSG